MLLEWCTKYLFALLLQLCYFCSYFLTRIKEEEEGEKKGDEASTKEETGDEGEKAEGEEENKEGGEAEVEERKEGEDEKEREEVAAKEDAWRMEGR